MKKKTFTGVLSPIYRRFTVNLCAFYRVERLCLGIKNPGTQVGKFKFLFPLVTKSVRSCSLCVVTRIWTLAMSEQNRQSVYCLKSQKTIFLKGMCPTHPLKYIRQTPAFTRYQSTRENHLLQGSNHILTQHWFGNVMYACDQCLTDTSVRSPWKLFIFIFKHQYV